MLKAYYVAAVLPAPSKLGASCNTSAEANNFGAKTFQ